MSSLKHRPSIQGSPGIVAMRLQTSTTARSSALKMIKAMHTVIWAFFAACIIAIPFASWRGEYRMAAWLAAMIFFECTVLLLNERRCPLSSVAGRYTADRRANFDIYLPEWLARHNQSIFGALYLVGVVFALAWWLRAAG